MPPIHNAWLKDNVMPAESLELQKDHVLVVLTIYIQLYHLFQSNGYELLVYWCWKRWHSLVTLLFTAVNVWSNVIISCKWAAARLILSEHRRPTSVCSLNNAADISDVTVHKMSNYAITSSLHKIHQDCPSRPIKELETYLCMTVSWYTTLSSSRNERKSTM